VASSTQSRYETGAHHGGLAAAGSTGDRDQMPVRNRLQEALGESLPTEEEVGVLLPEVAEPPIRADGVGEGREIGAWRSALDPGDQDLEVRAILP
jgi:hypothetical protein